MGTKSLLIVEYTNNRRIPRYTCYIYAHYKAKCFWQQRNVFVFPVSAQFLSGLEPCLITPGWIAAINVVETRRHEPPYIKYTVLLEYVY